MSFRKATGNAQKKRSFLIDLLTAFESFSN